MIINREWCMPNGDTFSIKPIKELIGRVIEDERLIICDPFVRNSPFKSRCISNDLDTEVEANFHMDALDFLKTRQDNEFDVLLFDPPYSPRQVSECYRKVGKTVNMQTTQASFWGNIKKEIGRVVRSNGRVISCGWNSGGIGKKHNFVIEEILMVCHGGWHNDTIVVVERKC